MPLRAFYNLKFSFDSDSVVVRERKVRRRGFKPNRAAVIGFALSVSSCAESPLTLEGSLSSYNNLTPSNGLLTKAMVNVNRADVLAATTVRITPTTFSETAPSAGFSDDQRRLIENAVDRSMCVGLSDRYRVVQSDMPADLTVRAVVTGVTATDELAAGASKVVSLIPTALSLGYPVPVPRIPIGLGSLSIEAEALGPSSDPKATMLWTRSADMLMSRPKVSKTGDAYDLAASFGDDFSKLLVKGESPFGRVPSVPSFQRIGSALGGAPKNSACENFGRDPGLIGMVGGSLGLPPEWTDKAGR